MEKLEVTIIPEDFKNAPLGYTAGPGEHGCVLQQALMRMYPGKYVRVGYSYAFIGEGPDQKKYLIDTSKWPDSDQFTSDKINLLSERAKESLEGIPSKTITLTLP